MDGIKERERNGAEMDLIPKTRWRKYKKGGRHNMESKWRDRKQIG